MAEYDAIVIGSGNNGLAAANVLVNEHLKVLVLEKNKYVGGGGATVELFKGFRHDIAAVMLFALSQRIVEDLELERYGLEVIDAPVLSCSISSLGEKPLVHYSDETQMMKQLLEYGGEDAVLGLAALSEFAQTVGEAIDRWHAPLPGPPKSVIDIINEAPNLEIKDRMRRLLLGSAMDVIKEFFPDPNKHRMLTYQLAFLAGLEIFRSPTEPGTGLHLIWSLALDDYSRKHYLRQIKGGMGMIMEGLRRRLEEKGGEVRLSSRVKRILVENGKAIGVELEKGEKITAKVILSNLDAYATFIALVGESNLSSDFAHVVKGIDYRCPYLNILLTLKELPKFAGDLAFLNDLKVPSFFIVDSPEHVVQGWEACKRGRIPQDPHASVRITSVYDNNVAPPGYHTANIFSSHFPITTPKEQQGRLKDEMAERIIDKLNKYAPNFRDAIIDKAVFAPMHYESMFGWTNGDYMHGALHLEQMLNFRPVVGWSPGYKTPVENLYLCGSACHPGPGVSFIPGYNSAHEVLKNWERKK